MCYANVCLPEPVSTTLRAVRVIAATVVMFLLMIVLTGCMNFSNCKFDVRDVKGSVQIGNKNVRIPVDIATPLPASALGVQ